MNACRYANRHNQPPDHAKCHNRSAAQWLSEHGSPHRQLRRSGGAAVYAQAQSRGGSGSWAACMRSPGFGSVLAHPGLAVSGLVPNPGLAVSGLVPNPGLAEIGVVRPARPGRRLDNLASPC